MPPAVAKAAQVRRAVSAIRVENDGNFRNLLVVQTGFDDHLAGELHPRSFDVQSLVGFLAERSQAAVRVADRRVKKEVQDARQDRIADIAMEPRHRPWPNPPLKAVPMTRSWPWRSWLTNGSMRPKS